MSIYGTAAELEAALAECGAERRGGRVVVTDAERFRSEAVDGLVWTAVFGKGEVREGASRAIRSAAASLGVPYVAVLPYPAMESVWRPEAQEHHRSLLGGAREVVTVGRKAPTTKQEAGAALGRRNDWLARHASDALVVWDGRDEATGRQLKSLESRLGSDNVQLVEP